MSYKYSKPILRGIHMSNSELLNIDSEALGNSAEMEAEPETSGVSGTITGLDADDDSDRDPHYHPDDDASSSETEVAEGDA